MNAVVFDTLRLAKRLEATGMSQPQAEGVAVALSETLGDIILTKRDLAEFEARMRADIIGVEDRLRGEARDVRGELRDIRGELREMEQRIIIRLGAMLAAAIVIVGAMVKLL